MDSPWIVAAVVVAVIIIVCIITSIYDKRREKAKKISSYKEQLGAQKNAIMEIDARYKSSIKDFFSSQTNNVTYDSEHKTLLDVISDMGSHIERMNAINLEIVKLSSKDDQCDFISQTYTQIILPAIDIAASFKAFGPKVYTLPDSKMMSTTSYGKVNKQYWDFIGASKRIDAVNYISKYENLLKCGQFVEFFSIEISAVLNCVWFFATEKTFSASDFQKATSLFSRIYKYNHADLIIAEFYAKKKMGGEDVLREPIRSLLKEQKWPRILTLVASGLMWMNAYQSENTVLQHMLNSGMEMTPKAQERLHSLTNGGGKSPSGYDVISDGEVLYFDVSALAWKDEEYVGLFENLAFQDKILSYGLAVRDENKELLRPQGLNLPDTNSVLNKLRAVFAEEYGPVVLSRSINCIALSGSGKENVAGIAVASRECEHMIILMHIAAIGKKLIIKFYTIFSPLSDDLLTQKQQALSMLNRLSPSVTMWESSLKDTMLIAVEQLLNANSQQCSTQKDGASSGTDPVF